MQLTRAGRPRWYSGRGLPEDERQALETQLGAAFAPFGVDAGYEIPGVALCAVAD